MRHQLLDQRQRDRHIAPQYVAHRQVDHRTVRPFAECRILSDDRISSSKMLAMADYRAFRVPGSAGCVDDKSGISGGDARHLRPQPINIYRTDAIEQFAKALQFWMCVAKHGGVIE